MITLLPKTLETYKIPQIEYIGDKLPVNKNNPPWRKRLPTAIKYLVIHHSASTGTIEAENRYHVNNNNWYRLSYHFSIDRGHIYQINDILDITAHAMGANDWGIGICVNWDLRLRPLTEFEFNALCGLVTTLQEMFPDIEIVGHNEISKRLANHITSCPVISMDKLRSDIMTAQMEQKQAESPQKKQEIAFRLMNQMNFFYNLSIGKNPDGTPAKDGDKKWGLSMILSMEDTFREKGFLK